MDEHRDRHYAWLLLGIIALVYLATFLAALVTITAD
jgi:hypothetical protein